MGFMNFMKGLVGGIGKGAGLVGRIANVIPGGGGIASLANLVGSVTNAINPQAQGAPTPGAPAAVPGAPPGAAPGGVAQPMVGQQPAQPAAPVM
jgi:hypothetical protein